MKSNLSSILPEPPDGTMVVILDWRDRTLIWRDDESGFMCSVNPDERWFSEATWRGGDAMAWDEITKYAAKAYLVPSEPVAEVAS